MKKITPNTILKQIDKTFTAVEVDGNIVWIDKTEFADETIAQTKPILQGIPVISLDSYVERLANEEMQDVFFTNIAEEKKAKGYFINGYKSNPAKWTDEDIERAIYLAQKEAHDEGGYLGLLYEKQEIMDKLSEISETEVDDDFNVLNYR
jgi:hypothetical protein